LEFNHLLIAIIPLTLIELVYLRLAAKYNIVDIPNERSSHEHLIIRGGGIVIPLAGVVGLFFVPIFSLELLLGLLIIAIISFLDDLYTIKPMVRITAQFLAVGGLLRNF